MRPEHLTDDEFCGYADSDDPWIKSAIERIERISKDNSDIDNVYSLIENATSMMR